MDSLWGRAEGQGRHQRRCASSVIIFSSGNLDAHDYPILDVSGSAVWTLYSDGKLTFSGKVSTGDVFTDQFYFAMASKYIADVDGKTLAYGVVYQGHTERPSVSWNKESSDPLITKLWPELCSHGSTPTLGAFAVGDAIADLVSVILGVDYFAAIVMFVAIA